MRRFARSSPFALLFLLCALPVLADAPKNGSAGVQETTAQIMERQKNAPPAPVRIHELENLKYPDRRGLPSAPGAPAVSQWPPLAGNRTPLVPNGPQTPGTQFTGATLADTGSFPPDTMGTVGPTQFVVFVNGRIRTFSKSTGVADAVLDANPDVFFASVMSSNPGTFTSDPRIRYDRFTGRWYLVIIDVPAGTGAVANRVLVAVSDASSATISGGTVWTFFFFQPEPTAFCDYPTLGVDVNALYIGGNIFTLAGAFSTTTAYVVRKSSILGAGPLVFTRFQLLPTSSSAGPYTPQGVDNDDPTATEGYFVGVDNAAFSLLQFRRISTPGGVPTISANIGLAVPTTVFPITVPHLGNTGGTNGNLDALDDRLFAAHIKNGHLWTAHNIQVNTAGVGSGTGGRNGSRWYDVNNLSTSPALVQSGTVFDNAATNPLSYWIPSIRTTGQGHSALGFSSAGAAARVNTATVGRLAGDTLGTTQTIVTTTASSTAYNPPADPGPGRRWGDYSFTSLDPLDDMTLWTIQEFCQATNSYAVQAVKLIAPPPATPTGSVTLAPTGAGQVITVNATSSGGSGFFDPGANLAPPALPFTHITASISPATNITINSVTYVNPTQIQLNVTTAGAAPGSRDLTITNPDGQSVTAVAYVGVTPVELKGFAAD